jgi:hypothetical protein
MGPLVARPGWRTCLEFFNTAAITNHLHQLVDRTASLSISTFSCTLHDDLHKLSPDSPFPAPRPHTRPQRIDTLQNGFALRFDSTIDRKCRPYPAGTRRYHTRGRCQSAICKDDRISGLQTGRQIDPFEVGCEIKKFGAGRSNVERPGIHENKAHCARDGRRGIPGVALDVAGRKTRRCQRKGRFCRYFCHPSPYI